MIEKRDFYINGQWVAPSAANDFSVINPSTEEPCAVISLGAQADTDAAVAAAKAALPGWMATPVRIASRWWKNWPRYLPDPLRRSGAGHVA